MKRELTLAIGAALLAASGSVFAITDIEVNAAIPFNLSNPGARSMGMGGAFVGLADDATAAYTNPAGITQLVTPEISAEGRHTEYSIPHITDGTASLSPFNGSGIGHADTDSSHSNLSFISLVYPRDRWSFAFYRNELLRYSGDFATGGDGIAVGNLYQTFPFTASSDLKIIDYGFSAAFKAGDSVSIGAGLSYYDFNINTSTLRVAFAGAFDGVAAGTPVNSESQHGSDNDVGVNLGARFVLSEHWSAGLTYRRGPEFTYEATNTVLLTSDGNPFVAVDLKNVRFKVPDEFGVGFSWHPTDALVVNLDADYVQYSQLTHGIQSLFGNGDATVASLSIPNGTELHLGGEYTFTQMAHPFSLRAGIWHDPRHSIEFKGDPGTDLGASALAVVFHGGQGAQNHVAVGGGFAFSKFQIDAAADFSDQTDTFSISGVYHF
jgi:long-subunit fatty acid transport protein